MAKNKQGDETSAWSVDALAVWSSRQDEGAPTVDESTQQAGADAGRAAGTFAGIFSGAKLGNAAIPVPILGTVVGGVVGGVVGSEIGQRLGRAFVSGGEAFWHTLQTPTDAGSR